MHTVERLEQALQLAASFGYRVRQDWLGGSGGGMCEIQGQKWLFLDLAQSATEHLDLVLEALRGEPGLATADLPRELAPLVRPRKSA